MQLEQFLAEVQANPERRHAVLMISDAEAPGCVNIHYVMGPQLDYESPSHNLMARVVDNLRELISAEAAENLLGAVKNAPNGN